MIRKNLLLTVSLAINSLVASSPAFAAGTSSNLWAFRKHIEEGGGVTITAEVLDLKNPPPDYKGDSEEDPGYARDLTAPAQLIFNTGSNRQKGEKFTAGYYRGPLYKIRDSLAPFASPEAKSTNYVSIFSNRDRSELIAVVDRGPIYRSTNSGLGWNIITAPGVYKFPLSTTPDGGGLYAQASIDRPFPPPETAASTNTSIPDWYAVTSSADGSKLVVTASASQPVPALNIRDSTKGITIVWPAQFTTFVLEQKTDLGYGSWTTVTNLVGVVDGENRVVVSPTMGSHFFRLRGR